jgi:glucose/arabinose dehydrogenase
LNDPVFLSHRVALAVLLLGSALGFTFEPSQAQPDPPGPAAVQLERVTDQLDQPVDFVIDPDGSGRWFVVEKPGKIVVLRNGVVSSTPFLDISSQVRDSYLEQGLLGLAFHPAYTSNGLFYVAYTPGPGQVALARFKASTANPDLAEPESGQLLLKITKNFDGHNGGHLLFGPDGYLYFGIGDGVIPEKADTAGHSQRIDDLQGKLLRLDVNGSTGGLPYAIPPDNPLVNTPGARGEIWAYGLRNPWRFTFDRATGDLYIGDVGLKSREEIDRQPAGIGGQNYGWSKFEGNLCHDPDSCDAAGFTAPIFDYDRSVGGSVIGGYLYHGDRLLALQGRYVFGDYKNGTVWALDPPDGGGAWTPHLLLETGLRITAFGEDRAGELYLTDFVEHGLYKLAPAPA